MAATARNPSRLRTCKGGERLDRCRHDGTMHDSRLARSFSRQRSATSFTLEQPIEA